MMKMRKPRLRRDISVQESETGRKKHGLIVGGTRGIGQAFVRTLAQADHVVSVIGRRLPSRADRRTPHVHYWTADLLDGDRLSTVLTQILGRHGKLNSLVFFQRYRGKEDGWAGEIETSLTATRNIIERLAGDFSDGGGRSIVIVSSVAGHFVVGEQPLSYHVAKAGLNQMVRYYAVALGPKGIRVNSVSPSTVIKEQSRHFTSQQEQLLNLNKRIIPLGRMGTSEDVVQAIEFLCSPKASFITGQEIVVDGGLSLRSQESLARELIPGGRLR